MRSNSKASGLLPQRTIVTTKLVVVLESNYLFSLLLRLLKAVVQFPFEWCMFGKFAVGFGVGDL